MRKQDKISITMIVVGCIAIIALSLLGQHLEYCKNNYEAFGTIYAVDFQEDVTILKTDDGDLFGMKGTETWPKGTRVIITLNSQGTKTPIDDSIEGLRRP